MKNLKKLISKYHSFIGREDFESIEKLCDDGDILSACTEIADKNNITMFEGKGFDSPGYEMQSYFFACIDENGEIDGIVLNIESF